MSGTHRRSPTKSERTRERLLIAAEMQFARRGIEGTSLREIAANAGLTNNFSVQYHFGSKEGLLEELFRFRMLQMEASRARMLERAGQQGNPGDLRTLMEIICLPHLDLRHSDGRYYYAEFLAQYVLRYRPPLFDRPGPVTDDAAPHHLFRAQALLRERLSGLPDDVFERRLVTAVLAFLAVLIRLSSESAATGEEVLHTALADTIAQIAVAMDLPFDPAARLPL